ncbi:MAG TPA: histidine kinase [Flavisolibacter sp.]|jgi:hypothetical protein|nr:histidine kinase [Flavisolibacter sp.]
MQWHEFVFSEKKEKRLLRHAVFWAAWWLYFSCCDYLFQQPIRGIKAHPVYVTTGSHILLNTVLLVSVYAIASYVFINRIFSLTIKAKWQKAMMNLLLFGVCLFTSGYFIFWYGFPLVDSLSGSYKPNHFTTWFWPAVYLGLVNPVKVVAAAGIIKYVKYWWLKQRESERLEKEKINAELQLLKAQVHPDFLLNTLDSIYCYARSSSPQAPAMLLKLSDLLSYMLYECEDLLVPLEREIAMMKEYMDLERMRQGGKTEIEITVKGDLNGKQIAPFLLLPFIGNSFNHCSLMTDPAWINMEIKMDADLFSMKLTNGLPEKMNENTITPIALDGVKKRLFLLYAGQYELKMTTEQEMFIVILNIRLKDTLSDSMEGTTKLTSVNKQKGKAVLDYARD